MILRPLALAALLMPAPAPAQERVAALPPEDAGDGAAVAAVEPPPEDENPAIADFTSINLPTTLRLPRHKVAFRVTHRFGRALGDGSFSDLASDFFGFDSGAQIGLELRFGLFDGTQLGLYRTSDKTIQLFAQQRLLRQGGGLPFALDAYATWEGADNLQAQHAPGIALVLARTLGERAALYAMPAFVGNTNTTDAGGDDDTILLGLAGRLRLGEDYAIVAEAAPRLWGHEHQEVHLTFGFERRAGGHNFQLNFSNAIGSTLAQVARGGGAVQHDGHTHGHEEGRSWYIGFNLGRKFY
jgi:hypothetical protein